MLFIWHPNSSRTAHMLVCAQNQFCFYSLERRGIQKKKKERKHGTRETERRRRRSRKQMVVFQVFLLLELHKNTAETTEESTSFLTDERINELFIRRRLAEGHFSWNTKKRLARQGKIPHILSLSHFSSPSLSLSFSLCVSWWQNLQSKILKIRWRRFTSEREMTGDEEKNTRMSNGCDLYHLPWDLSLSIVVQIFSSRVEQEEGHRQWAVYLSLKISLKLSNKAY